MKIGDEVYIHGYIDEIRNDTVIIKNDGGYFGTVESEVVLNQPESCGDAVSREEAKWGVFCNCDHAKNQANAFDELPSAQPEYYDYSDIEPLWKSFAEENDINLTDTAKQLKDAMWCGYRKGKADAQSEPCDDAEFWRKRAEEYMDQCIALTADMVKGVKFDSVCFDENGLAFKREQRWIPCSGTIDIPHHEVLCCDMYGEELIGWLSYVDDRWFCESDGEIMYDPVAWREKPEPYRKER